MNKEKLIELGLTEEQADSVIGSYGHMVPKSRFDEKNDELKEAYKTISKHELDLEELKPKLAGNEALLAQISELQDANNKAREQYDSELTSTRLNNALKFALHGKVQDSEYAISKLDKSKIVLDENFNIVSGFDDQFEEMKVNQPFNIITEKVEEPVKPATPQFANSVVTPPSGAAPDAFASKIAKYL